MTDSKYCSSCNIEKPLEDFAKEEFGGRFGRKAQCRVCFRESHRAYNRDYYIKNKERLLRRMAERYAEKVGKK